MDKEKIVFKFENLFFSPNKKDWLKVGLFGTTENIWINSDMGWKKFPNMASSIVNIKDIPKKKSAILTLKHKEAGLYLGGAMTEIHSLHNSLKSLIKGPVAPTQAPTKRKSKFLPEEKLVLQSISKGKRTIGDIAFDTQLEYKDVQKVFETFISRDYITPWGSVTAQGQEMLQTECYT